ncbi:MAG: T9SS type A sorting domain-containing protein [Sporocytophaga sp.]|uniref:T9SS type A sorting domain-containing protein n=1 Tax=Sporocytophaga sp. TaxID=2231183 RepID=UPI001B06EFE1|nr:T9SS type A sorting domain-containing protein [Sporocytophaga sp.]MBO9698936.1 T9SS type A sorting domain-containing protein [Sporocytophaga sp.]
MKNINTYKFLRKIFLISTYLISTVTFAHWNSKGPFGGSASCMHTADTNTYVGTNGGGIFRTTNKQGIKWTATNAGLKSGDITSLTSIGSYVLAGTPDEGIFLSKDLGKNWIQVNSGLGSTNITALTSSGKYVYAGTKEDGVFMSADSGHTWKAANQGILNKKITCLTTFNQTIIAGTDGGGIFTVMIDTELWSGTEGGIQERKINSVIINPSSMLLGTDKGIYKSSASGTPWTLLNDALSNTSVNLLYQNGDVIYACTDIGLFTSPQTINWTKSSLGLTSDTITSITALQSKLFIGTKVGIFSSQVSQLTWQKANESFFGLNIKGLAINGTAIVGATNMGVYYISETGASYTARNNGLLDSLSVSDLNFSGTNLIATTLAGNVYISADTGKVWVSLSSGLNGDPLVKIAVRENKLLVATSTGKVFYSNPTNINWIEMNSGLPTGLKITALIANGSDAYLAADNEGVFKLSPGTDWQNFSSGLTDLKLTSLALVDGTIFAGTDGSGVFSTVTTADSWKQINNGLPTLNITSLCAANLIYDGVTYPYVYAGYKGGVYFSFNKGEEWRSPDILANLPLYADITQIALSSNRIFVGTPNNSLYSNSKSETEPIVSSIFSKDNNENVFMIYPNPGKESFKINFASQQEKIKTIFVYDFSGKAIDNFIASEDGLKINAPQGIYFVRIETADGKSSTEKLIIQ